MFLSRFKNLSSLIAIILSIPVFVVLGYFTNLYIASAFPSNSLAAERFEESGLYEFPGDAIDLYFRIAMPSPIDQGGSALKFSAGEAALSKILSTVPSGFEWQPLEREFLCNCLQCIRYTEPVKVPMGSIYWKHNKGSSDYQLLAVNLQTKQVFWCEQDT